MSSKSFPPNGHVYRMTDEAYEQARSEGVSFEDARREAGEDEWFCRGLVRAPDSFFAEEKP